MPFLCPDSIFCIEDDAEADIDGPDVLGYFYVAFSLPPDSTDKLFMALEESALHLEEDISNLQNAEDAKTLRAAAEIMRRITVFSTWRQFYQEPSTAKVGVCSSGEAKILLKARHLTAFVSMGLYLFQINSDARGYFQSKGSL
jgi:hypothetical protein